MTGDGRRIVVLYTLAGAAAGVLVNVLYFASPEGKTNILTGTLFTLWGGIAGLGVGRFLGYLTSSQASATRAAVGCGVIILAALGGASVGWTAGNLSTRQHPEREYNHQRGTMLGGAIGAATGLLALVPSWLRRPGNTPPESPARDHPS